MLSSNPIFHPLTTDFTSLINEFEAKLKNPKLRKEVFEEWRTNQKLREWYLGALVQFGHDEQSIRMISLDDLEKIFCDFIKNNHYSIADSIWDLHKNFEQWFTGQTVNIGTEAIPFLYNIPLAKVIGNFKFLLQKQRTRFLGKLWHSNETLRAWFAGKEVNFGTDENPHLRIISKEELLNTFKLTLGTRRPEIIKLLFNNNPLLADWFSGKTVNFGTTTTPNLQTITPKELIKSFNFMISSRDSEITIWTWGNNTFLPAWFSGEKINFGTPENPILRSISSDEIFATAKRVLIGRCLKLKKILEEIEIFKNCFNEMSLEKRKPSDDLIESSSAKRAKSTLASKPDNLTEVANYPFEFFKPTVFEIDTDLSNDLIPIKEDDDIFSTPINSQLPSLPPSSSQLQSPSLQLLNEFEQSLHGTTKKKPIQLWNESPIIQQWYLGQALDVSANQISAYQTISFDQLNKIFKLMLAKSYTPIIKAIWEKSNFFRNWYRGDPINFGTNENPDIRTISLPELINHFNLALHSKYPFILKFMWDNNNQLQAWITNPLHHFIKQFKRILSTKCHTLTNQIWFAYPQLQAWFRGDKVNFGTDENPNICTASAEELVRNFKIIISSRCLKIILSVWTDNWKLQNAIKNLDEKKASAFLDAVLTINVQYFKSDYLKTIKKDELFLKTLLSLENQSTKSEYTINKIKILKQYFLEANQELACNTTISAIPDNQSPPIACLDSNAEAKINPSDKSFDKNKIGSTKFSFFNTSNPLPTSDNLEREIPTLKNSGL